MSDRYDPGAGWNTRPPLPDRIMSKDAHATHFPLLEGAERRKCVLGEDSWLPGTELSRQETAPLAKAQPFQAGSAWSLRPSAPITLRMVPKLGLRSPESAL